LIMFEEYIPVSGCERELFNKMRDFDIEEGSRLFGEKQP
jgi:hypothetical protein